MTADGQADLHELLQEVRRIRLQVESLAADQLAGGYRSAFQGAGIEFDEVREYVPGDDPRSIDWNVTARVGRPYIKKYVDERERTLLLLLDLSPSMEAGFGVWSLRDAAVRLAALLVVAAQRYDDPVGWVAFGGEVEHAVPPRKGPRHGFGVVRDALALPQSSGGPGLSAALERATRMVRRRSTVFVLSDFLQSGWQDAMRLCARHHDVVALPLLPAEFFAPPQARVRFRRPGSSTTQIVDGRSPAVREAWERAAQARRDAWREDFKRAGADGVEIEVPREPSLEQLARPLQRYFERRKRARRAP
ncbi:MAG: hypothetical protein CMJ94_05760 [Planctomycetes bacterium]|nr:hypothetical protein [Planctomycetota bacterium]